MQIQEFKINFKLKLSFLLHFFLISLTILAQQEKADSIEKRLPSLNGKEKVDALNKLAQFYVRNDADKSSKFSAESIEIATKINYSFGLVDAYGNMAYAKIQNSFYQESLDYSLKALKIAEPNNMELQCAESYTNIATAYLNLFNFKLADQNYLIAAKLYRKLGDSTNLAIVYNNMAVSFDNRELLDSALFYYNKCLPIYKSLSDNEMYLGLWYTNVGDLLQKQNKNDLALEYQLKAEPHLINAGDEFTLMVLYSGIPYTLIKKKDLNRALNYAEKSIALAKKLNTKRELAYSYMSVSDVYEAQGNYKKQSEYLKRYVALSDSLFNEETSSTVTEMQTKYESEKKQNEIKLLNKDRELKSIEIEKQKSTSNFYIGLAAFIFLLVIAVAIALINKYKANKILTHQKRVIEIQKSIVDSKNKEIVDSIEYAKYLQEAILPSKEFLDKLLEEYFVLYKPKDIVAGDFYFAEFIDDKIFIAAADSTGHGVPGAMVSVVCSNALNRSLKEFRLTETGKILDKTRELVIETFEKSTKDVKDGMDISFLCIDKNARKIYWSGANNPLLYFQMIPKVPEVLTESIGFIEVQEGSTLKEIKAHKQPIGKTHNPSPFPSHSIDIKPGMIFYLITDGFADQFGGPEGKKFKNKRLKELLEEIKTENLEVQKAKLANSFDSWKGKFEQIDDICIIGIKL